MPKGVFSEKAREKLRANAAKAREALKRKRERVNNLTSSSVPAGQSIWQRRSEEYGPASEAKESLQPALDQQCDVSNQALGSVDVGRYSAKQSDLGERVEEGGRCLEDDQQIPAGPERVGGIDQPTNPPSPSADTGLSSVEVGNEYLKLADPVCWGEICFAVKLDAWQVDRLRAFQRAGRDKGAKDRIAAAVCNNGGKSLLFAVAGSWNIGVNPRSRSVMTAGVYRQCKVMRDYLIPALPRFNAIQPGWSLLDDQLIAPPYTDGWEQRFLWYSADNPGFFEGQHADNLALLLDECKSIKTDMAKNALIRLAPKRVLAMSSTGDAIGWFADIFGREGADWDAKTVSAFDCREQVRQWAEAEAKRRGGLERARMDPDFCSAVLSEFGSGSANALFSLQAMQHCRRMAPHIPHHHDRVVVAGLDASKASGEGDECVLRFRLGNKLYPAKKFIGFTSPVDLAGSILEELIAHKVQYLNYDSADLGVGGILARMIDSQKGRIKLNAIAFGGKPNNPEMYHNKRVEMYYAFKNDVERNEVIFPDDAEELIAQLSTIQRKPTETGIKKLVSKADMRKEGIRSPDDADATVLCWQKPVMEKPTPLSADLNDWLDSDQSDHGKHTDPGWHPAGFYLGKG